MKPPIKAPVSKSWKAVLTALFLMVFVFHVGLASATEGEAADAGAIGSMTAESVVPAASGPMPIDAEIYLAGERGTSDRPPIAGETVDVVATLSWAGSGIRPRVKEVPALVPEYRPSASSGRASGQSGQLTATGSGSSSGPSSASVQVEKVGVTARTVYSAGRPVWSQSFTYHLRLGGPGRVVIPSLEFRCEVGGTEETVSSPPLEFEVLPAPEPGLMARLLGSELLPLAVGVAVLAWVFVKVLRRRRQRVALESGSVAWEAERRSEDLRERLGEVAAAARKVTAGDDAGAMKDLVGILDRTLGDNRGIHSKNLDRGELLTALDGLGIPGEMSALAAEIHEAGVNLRYGGICPDRERVLRLFSKAPVLIRCLCEAGGAASFSCPSCGASVMGEDERCPTCGEEFEKIRKESR